MVRAATGNARPAGLSIQVPLIEGLREEIGQAMPADLVEHVDQNHLEIPRIFPEQLTTRAAGRRRGVRTGDDCEPGERLLPVRERLEQRNALRADGLPVC